MSDDDDPNRVLYAKHMQPADTVIEIDANVIGQIILEEAHCSATTATKAANRVIEYISKQVEGSHSVS